MLRPHNDPKARSAYPKRIFAWLEPDYFRRPRPLRAWRPALGWGVLVLGVAVTAGLLAARDRRAFEAAPVSRVHRLIDDDCQACHAAPFKTAERLWRPDDTVHSVTEAACQRCHFAPEHHRRQVGAAACADCHREHRGDDLRAQTNESACTACHAHLANHTDTARPSDAERAFRDVAGMATHPEFALIAAAETDGGTIAFNHRKHLPPGGLPAADGRAARRLSCRDCHEPDDAGRSMRPIRYDRHCRDCPPLRAGVAGQAVDVPLRRALAALAAAPLPHPSPGGNARSVRAALRDRYAEFAHAHPKVVDVPLDAPPARPLPGAAPDAHAPTAQREWAWVAAQLARGEDALFGRKAGCLYCHQEKGPTPPGAPPALAAAGIRARWLPHSVFAHESHRALDCQQCHAGASQSEHTAQVLMPGVAVCQQCHRPGPLSARADCNECHRYHNRSGEQLWSGNLTVDDLMRGVAPPTRPNETPHGQER
jgi:hypothetical protein